MSKRSFSQNLRAFGVALLRDGPPVLTLLACVGLAIAASFMQLDQDTILQGLLTINVLLAATLLSERWIVTREDRAILERISDDVQSIDGQMDGFGQSGLDALVGSRVNLDPLEQRLSGAKSLKVSGGSLFRLANEYRKLFEELATEGCSIQLVMCDPDGQAIGRICDEVVYETEDVEAYRNQAQTALNTFAALQDKFENFEIRVCDVALSFSVFAVERLAGPNTASVELYPFKVPARQRPMLHTSSDESPEFYALALSQFDALWKNSRAPGSVTLPAPQVDGLITSNDHSLEGQSKKSGS